MIRGMSELGIDPERVIAVRFAGGHVAAATATINKFNEDGEDLSFVPTKFVGFI